MLSLSVIAGQRGEIGHYTIVPFPFIQRTIGYRPLLLGLNQFYSMAAVWVTLPKGFAKLKAPQKCLQLEYGYKHSGIVRLYEVPTVKGTTSKKLLGAVFDSGCFKDVQD